MSIRRKIAAGAAALALAGGLGLSIAPVAQAGTGGAANYYSKTKLACTAWASSELSALQARYPKANVGAKCHYRPADKPYDWYGEVWVE